jgi:2-(1,2-epoxy-1,2-dihydrophenyl)acetyl-CoA isomerase
MSHIQTRCDDAVGTIRIERREHFNSLDVETARDFRRAGLRFARDEAVRAVLLCGSGGVFCSGADLKYVREGGDPTDLDYLQPEGGGEAAGHGAAFKQILEYLHSAISEIRRAPKPFIAAVDGVAAAGGFGLAMCCDLVFASERASFEWAYAKTGLTGAESSTYLLPRLVGLRRAMDLVLRNPRLDARAALEAGLVNEVLPVEGFDAAVLGEARRLADGPTQAFAVAKALLNRAAGLDGLDVHLDAELEHLSRIADGPEFRAGLARFFDRPRSGSGSEGA